MINLESLNKKSFIDDTLQSTFFEDGYILIRECIDETVLDNLSFLFLEKPELYASPYFISTIELKDIEHRNYVNNVVKASIYSIIEKYILDYTHFYGGFGVKLCTGDSNFLDLHQDTTMVSYEGSRTGLTAWIPLIDVDENNGCLYVIPKSHKYNRLHRPTGTSFPYTEHKQYLKDNHLVSIPMNRGDLLIMDQSLIHCSAPNNSDLIRVAVMGMYRPDEDNLVYYNYLPATKEVEVFDVDDDYYINNNLGERPNLNPSQIIPFNDCPYLWFKEQ